MNSLKSMLRENRVLVGLTVQHVCSPWLAKVYKNSGTDFVYIEYEHSFMNEADLANLVLACESCNFRKADRSAEEFVAELQSGVVAPKSKRRRKPKAEPWPCSRCWSFRRSHGVLCEYCFAAIGPPPPPLCLKCKTVKVQKEGLCRSCHLQRRQLGKLRVSH